MADIHIPNIRFIDIAERERLAGDQVEADVNELESRAKRGRLSAADEEELKRLKALQAAKAPKYLDPLFAATRAAFANADNGMHTFLMDHADGILDFSPTGPAAARRLPASNDALVVRTSLVLGLLQLHGARLPLLKVEAGKVVPDKADANAPYFVEAFLPAVGRVTGSFELAAKVLKLIAGALNVVGDAVEPKVSSLEYARVFEKVMEQGVKHDDPNLKPRVEDFLDKVLGTGDEKPEHEITIKLPDLEATTDHQVIKAHIEQFGCYICASMFDELKAFQVVDKLVEISQRGELPLIKGKAGTLLYRYWRQAPNRMSEMERQTFYAMTLGIPTGQPGVHVNTEFQDLWIRFVSSVSSLVREYRVDQLLRSSLPAAINQQQVKKAARDLSTNMSLYGYGMAFYAAVDLQKQIEEMIDLLQDVELRSAFGARDMWGVIDQIAQVELGGARNSSKYRTLATCGAIITKWLAQNTGRISDPTTQMVRISDVENPPGHAAGETATSKPNDYDLVNACELWLADSAMSEARVEELSQPRESPQQTSRPIQVPSIARELLEGTGLGFEMSARAGNGARPNGRGRAGYSGY